MLIGIPSPLFNQLRAVLSDCDAFDSNRSLRSLFTQKSLSLWRSGLPEAQSLAERVDAVISYLHNKRRADGSNGLLLLVQALTEQVDPDDLLHGQLAQLTIDLDQAFTSSQSQTAPLGQTAQPVTTVPPAEDAASASTLAAPPTNVGKKDFFISYTGKDRHWAEWIAWHLEATGYSTIIQAWDFRAGGNFVTDMHQATMAAERTIAVLSDDYLKSGFAQSEWNAAFRLDPIGEKGLLVPVRIKNCHPEGLLGAVVYIDLVDLDETAAKEALLAGMQKGRKKPAAPPQFPGTSAGKPEFPGGV